MTEKSLLLIELNEINFEFVTAYVQQGRLPNFASLIEKHGVTETTSEQRYEDVEPWIQWVTAHTGLTLAEHGVFRLGDIAKVELSQIWEQLEAKGLKVGAVSPINGKNRTQKARFFIPDPWTVTPVTGSFLTRKMYIAIAQAVNDNAQSRLTIGSVLWLLIGALVNARITNYFLYFKLAIGARRRSWFKAMFLDLLLADVFVNKIEMTRPNFASLFLNAGAHIQHHYLFSSSVYRGAARNPDWYVPASADPVLDVYSIYDRVVGQIMLKFKDTRIMIATGLHQNPHERNTFYWRLKNHANFLSMLTVPFVTVEPRMSRDFVVFCASRDDAFDAEEKLCSAVSHDGLPLFDVDNRGNDLFVMLSYPNDIGNDFKFAAVGKTFRNFREHVAFVAIKNGEHDGAGYFIDSGLTMEKRQDRFPLAKLPGLIFEALGV